MPTQTIISIVSTVGIVLGIVLFPAVLMWIAARPILSRRARMEPLDPDKHGAFLNATRDFGLWAERHGWHWVGAFSFPAGSVAETLVEAWSFPGLDRYLLVYQHRLKPAPYINFMTLFDDANHLDTLTSRDDLLIPDIPGRFVQVFPGQTSLDALWRLHEQGEQWAAREHGLRPRPACEDFDAMWVDGTRRVIRGMFAKPLWFLRVWIWYTRQATLAGKPVWDRPALRPALATGER